MGVNVGHGGHRPAIGEAGLRAEARARREIGPIEGWGRRRISRWGEPAQVRGKSPAWKARWWWKEWWVGPVALLLVGGFVLLLVIGILGGNDGEAAAAEIVKETQVPLATPTEIPAPTPAPPPTFEELKALAVDLSHDDIFRNNEDHVGKIVAFDAKVIQVVEVEQGFLDSLFVEDDAGELRCRLRANVTRGRSGIWQDTMLLFYSGDRLLEDDIIEVVETVRPLVRYKSIFGQQITIPGIEVRQARLR